MITLEQSPAIGPEISAETGAALRYASEIRTRICMQFQDVGDNDVRNIQSDAYKMFQEAWNELWDLGGNDKWWMPEPGIPLEERWWLQNPVPPPPGEREAPFTPVADAPVSEEPFIIPFVAPTDFPPTQPPVSPEHVQPAA